MRSLLFFPGLHQPGDAPNFRFACISINRLWTRKRALGRQTRVFVDSAAYTILDTHGRYPESHSVERYAQRLYELHTQGVVRIIVASAQDYMCEPHIRAKTGLSIEDHQRLTIERYDALVAELKRLFGGKISFHVMPVLQGQSVDDYLRHMEMYGERLTPGMWVGVGSVCKRQGRVSIIEDLLLAIKEVRPDLRLHGFWREVDGALQRRRAPAAAHRRQHGLELQRPETGPQRQRLARGAGLRPQGRPTGERTRTASIVCESRIGRQKEKIQ